MNHEVPASYEALTEAVKALANGTGLDIRLGYIGNCDGARYDDRKWYVWVGNARTSNNNLVQVAGGARTEELAELLSFVTREKLVKALTRNNVHACEVKNWNLEVTTTYEESLSLIAAVIAA